jgi:hypothetical protein
MCLQFGFEFFWQNDFGTKAAQMLLTLTPGVVSYLLEESINELEYKVNLQPPLALYSSCRRPEVVEQLV